ncbi:MAG TPA: hypothetical protein VM513_06135 [Kofleriaceae bacterium]|nr:hypothetical protein [Kofleriaceae bacterium]
MKKLVCLAMLLSVGACASDEDDCSGSVLGCTWAELSERQEMEACDLISASINAPAGTKYECTSGQNAGLYLEVDTAATCVSRSYSASCPVTVQDTLDCFKAAQTNACSAFEDRGACGMLFAVAAQCQ